MTTQRISLVPDTPTQAQDVQICYDFGDLSLSSTRLKVSWQPPGLAPIEHVVTSTNNSFTISVPATATHMTVEDCDGPSADLDVPVQPAGAAAGG